MLLRRRQFCRSRSEEKLNWPYMFRKGAVSMNSENQLILLKGLILSKGTSITG